MELSKNQFLGTDAGAVTFEDATVIVVPFGYEGGASYGKGTAKGPEAIIDASSYLELYDEVLDVEPYKVGICTVTPPGIPKTPEAMNRIVYETTGKIVDQDKFIVSIGGDHSITPGCCRALQEKQGALAVIQIDAHADLRRSYQGSKLSHACVMSRIREMTSDTLQLGIRSLSADEAQRIRNEQIAVCTMHEFRAAGFNLTTALQRLPDPVFITFDVDVFDWSVVRSTGTPEPGGMLWDEAMSILQQIFSSKRVVGFDVVELAHDEHDRNSAFAAAKLIYKMIGFKFISQIKAVKEK